MSPTWTTRTRRDRTVSGARTSRPGSAEVSHAKAAGANYPWRASWRGFGAFGPLDRFPPECPPVVKNPTWTLLYYNPYTHSRFRSRNANRWFRRDGRDHFVFCFATRENADKLFARFRHGKIAMACSSVFTAPWRGRVATASQDVEQISKRTRKPSRLIANDGYLARWAVLPVCCPHCDDVGQNRLGVARA
jgi:hypothetical protein